jgi:hypothetical protein
VPRSKNRVELYLYSPQGSSRPVERIKPAYKLKGCIKGNINYDGYIPCVPGNCVHCDRSLCTK